MAPAIGRADPVRVVTTAGVALAGRDAVAYFTEGRAVPGEAAHALKWRGAVWYFASASHMMAFEMNPAAYLPQYGGNCAVAMAEGRSVPGDPDLFVIHDGRLYLLHDAAGQTRMATRTEPTIAAADDAWRAILAR